MKIWFLSVIMLGTLILGLSCLPGLEPLAKTIPEISDLTTVREKVKSIEIGSEKIPKYKLLYSVDHPTIPFQLLGNYLMSLPISNNDALDLTITKSDEEVLEKDSVSGYKVKVYGVRAADGKVLFAPDQAIRSLSKFTLALKVLNYGFVSMGTFYFLWLGFYITSKRRKLRRLNG